MTFDLRHKWWKEVNHTRLLGKPFTKHLRIENKRCMFGEQNKSLCDWAEGERVRQDIRLIGGVRITQTLQTTVKGFELFSECSVSLLDFK